MGMEDGEIVWEELPFPSFQMCPLPTTRPNAQNVPPKVRQFQHNPPFLLPFFIFSFGELAKPSKGTRKSSLSIFQQLPPPLIPVNIGILTRFG
jgi:hypothetical protein